jgi:hypothetical protein
VLLGQAYRASGNKEDAELELQAAATSFERLGAAADARKTAALLESYSNRAAVRDLLQQ